MPLKFNVGPEVFKVDLSPLANCLDAAPATKAFFLAERGEHYKLLAFLAGQLEEPSTVVDIGTATGASALALYAGGVQVVSYDIDHSQAVIPCALVPMRTEDGIAAIAKFTGHAVDPSLIFLDVDPHNGAQEREAVARLTEAGWSGILICDDIHLNPQMEEFWREVSLPKWDLTEYGHFTGTGAIGFGGAEICLPA